MVQHRISLSLLAAKRIDQAEPDITTITPRNAASASASSSAAAHLQETKSSWRCRNRTKRENGMWQAVAVADRQTASMCVRVCVPWSLCCWHA